MAGSIPKGYRSLMNIQRTEIAIKRVKDLFEAELAAALNLIRVSAPMFVKSNTGLNDSLNGVERPVAFDLLHTGEQIEVIHSLAKWKRYALAKYGFSKGQGLYTDVNAIRRDEVLDSIHSIYVDQWDWELIIDPEERTESILYQTVERIYSAILRTETILCSEFSELSAPMLPPRIHFVTAQELEDCWPDLSSKERETRICKEKGAVFIRGIGGKLASGNPHDGRAPDYDDWDLNGDLLLYYPLLESAFELSSMGIRVDPQRLRQQLKESGHEEWMELPFQKDLLAGKLPQTMGGGIGQSRLCMFFLRKAHIGEVQASIWPEEMEAACSQAGVHLL